MKNLYRKLIIILGIVLFNLPSLSLAASYLEKKDNDALDSIDRVLNKASGFANKKVFDGKTIVAGAEPDAVRLYFDTMLGYHDSAVGNWNGISKTGMNKPHAVEIVTRLQQFDHYFVALRKAYVDFSQQMAAAQQQAKVNHTASLSEQNNCHKFTKEIPPPDRESVKTLVKLQQGSTLEYFQTVALINEQRQIIKRLATLCAQPEFQNIEKSCLALNPANRPIEADYCLVPKHEQAILQQAAKNYASALMDITGASKNFDLTKFKNDAGWVKLEGPVSWDSLGKNEKSSKQILASVKPVFEAVGLNGAEDIEGLQKQNTKNSELAEAVKQLAPSWNFPGDACHGDPCKLAQKTLSKWYPQGKIMTVKQTQENWVVVKDEVNHLPDYRYRSGFAMVRVTGDPFCQLRSWTVREKYSGGGSYQTPDGASIGYVRWQACQ